VACISRLKEMDTHHYVKPFSLSDESFTLLSAELNDQQLTKCIYLKKLPHGSHRPEIKQAIRTVCFTSLSLKEVPGWAPQH
jgi:hypothetical protein